MRLIAVAVLCSAVACLSVAQESGAAAKRHVDIEPQGLGPALQALAKDQDFQVVYAAEDVENLRTGGVVGELTTLEALEELLKGTRLAPRFIDASTVTLVPVRDVDQSAAMASNPGAAGSNGTGRPDSNSGSGSKGVAADQESSAAAASSEGAKPPVEGAEDAPPDRDRSSDTAEARGSGIPEVLVLGSRTLNRDIRRTQDDPQPYVVFEGETLQKSGAQNLEEFFKQRLPMNSIGETQNQFSTTRPNASQINLRGLGTNQTLILVDGQRLADDLFVEGPQQGDINSIPLGAIERVEILPTTASGIYGGRATGGVVNIVLKRDYEGMQGEAGFDNTFESWSPTYRASLTGGLRFGEGRTSLLMSLNYSDTNDLLVRQRDLVDGYRARQVGNNPSFFSPPNLPDGSTTNIMSADGSPLFGAGTPSNTFVPVGYAGGGGIDPFVPNAGAFNTALSQTTGKLTLWNEATVKSALVTMRHDFTPRVQVFAEAATAQNDGKSPFSADAGVVMVTAAAPSNPFGQDVLIRLSDGIDSILSLENRTRRLRLGSIVRFGQGWNAEFNYLWSDARNNTTAQSSIDTFALEQAIANGDVDPFRDTTLDPIDFTPYELSPPQASEFSTETQNVSLVLGGTIGQLPAGAPRLTTKLEYRDETFDPASVVFDPSFGAFFSERSQEIGTIYSEILVPLVSSRNHRTGIDELELQVAGRYDRYRTVTSIPTIGAPGTNPPPDTHAEQSSFNPTIALRYQVLPDLALRASYGTGFLPPSISNLAPFPPETLNGILTDPRRGDEVLGDWDLVSGGNPDLDPEESTSWSGGLIFTPRAIPDLRLSIDYTRIEKTDNIFDPFDLPFIDLAAFEQAFPDRVTRDPAAPGDPFGVGPITAIDVTAINISEAMVEAYDFSLNYHLETGSSGTIDFFLIGTRQTHFETQLLPSEPVVENVGLGSSNPLKFKANAGITWNLANWTFGWIGRYFDSYTVSLDPNIVESQGATRVDDQSYHDIFASYRFDGSGVSWLDDTEITLGITNVFNEEPPFDAANRLRLYSPFGDPRLASYSLKVRMGF